MSKFGQDFEQNTPPPKQKKSPAALYPKTPYFFSPAALLRPISPYKTLFVCTLNPIFFACGALIERPGDFLRFNACYKGKVFIKTPLQSAAGEKNAFSMLLIQGEIIQFYSYKTPI